MAGNGKGMQWRWLAAAAAAAMCVGAAGCGTSDASSDGESSATVTSYDVSSVETDEQIAALVPQAVKVDGKLTIGTDTSYAPAEFLDADGKTPVGFEIDLGKAVAKVMGLEADPQTATFDLIIPAVGSKYEVGISAFTVTPEREESVDFVTYYNAGSSWVTQKGNPDGFDSSSLCGLKIAVQTGTTQETELEEENAQCKADGKGSIEILSSALQTDVTTNVATGKAVAFYADSPVAGYAVEQTGGTLETVGETEGMTPEGIVVEKGNDDLANAVQQALQKLIDDGTYGKILKNWGVESGAIEKAEINPSVG